MKKIILALLLIVNSVFAITLSQIDLGTYPRAFITQVDIRDSRDLQNPAPLLLTKLNTVTYQYWYASYPYDSLKYSGKIEDWWYTLDYSEIQRYESWYDTYINPNDLSVTYIYVNLQGYSSTTVSVLRSDNTVVPYYTTLSNGFRVYRDTNSASRLSYKVKTHIQASDGTVDLYNNVSVHRNTY